ncbi:putative bifunctional diguanylate cyclase/phosphodiesterase [Granulosicoccus antarcticus]|uniref:Cyclic di-GMP phosphodiesterase PdeB n=1 Tax=Granulosicoccus antarcticus IMCC3135 TaxID=1192854 RepID=A0A2Z2NT45_9GAMM|nr:EAL domain-containing protein [Granulosicoccus antarcticus]ASJ74676.1 Cyclic di-GMP phosphodiesterase PdeB [Granulosicoccus antarcticus IMCC3135]
MIIQHANRDHTRLLIGAGVLLVFSLMIFATWQSMTTLQAVNEGMSNLITDTEEKTSRAYHMRNVIRMRSGAVRSLVQTEDTVERQRIFDKMIEYSSAYQKTRDELIELTANARERTILEEISKADDRVSKAYERANSEIYSAEDNLDAQKSVLHEVQLHELVLLNHLNELVQLEKVLAEEALNDNQVSYKQTQRIMIYTVIAAFALSMIISLTVIARVARANKRIAHLANHDDLTGLHNRRSFEQHLQYTIDIADRSENTYGLLYLDLDRFKIVNDTCGHHAGDQLLIQLTQSMHARLRRGDLFARVGGDEFAIIAQGKSFEDIQSLAEDLRVIVCEFIFRYEEQSFKVSLSIGVTPIDGQIQSMERVLADVDSACYVAKQTGRNRVHVTQDDDAEVVKYRSNLAGIQAIRKALTDDRLALFYQPIFQIEERSMKMTHCEILLRIRNENGEMYSPARFIPIAEKYNIMTEIDQWVFSQVIDWLAAHQDKHVIPRLLVNLSGLSFTDEDFSNFVVERLSRGDVNPAHIAFEISEGATFRNFDKVSLFIERIRGMGCELALDDFGSGLSSFSYLKKLSFDYLKIDGSLVRNIANNQIDHDMVKAINQIGHTVNAKTIAEFVEDDAALSCLRDMKVDYAQGYGLRMPTPLTQLADELPLLEEGQTNMIDDPDQDIPSIPFRKAS